MSGKKCVLTQTSNFSGEEEEDDGGRVFGGGEMRRRRLGGEMGGADRVCRGGLPVGDAARGNAGIDQVMLRFRPIAPKPATEGPGQGGSHAGSKGWPLSGARTKRKYVRVRKPKGNSNCSSNNNNSSTSSSTSTKSKRAVAQGPKGKAGGPDGSLGLEKQIVTLQLLPEKADHGESKALKAKPQPPEQEPRWCTTNSCCGAPFGPDFSTVNLALPNRVPPMWPRSDPIHRIRYPRVLECWVFVESVADARIDAQDPQLVGLTDAERMRNLETDACPGFLADPSDRVKWVNGAFERMVIREHLSGGTDSGPPPAGIAVRVVAREELPKTRAAFACRATVRQREEKWAARIMPCDVWRMDEVGGFAWRLDVEAALSLGLR
ncbi:uncharacterized protein LOC115751162 [Rhodamnia argentea]|uniref:Uncharacterized protein LOC115751162 n=1 Tax=Rhodamnia argentea TaxID=178133 RepID=A0ABM3GVZ8_9MYRT|nr:uncharacterized protein LOC115751162 [Rhodamnia argentea]XP_048128512.1 uncharacterized protein LOC115751162 [Rhodamnia argentea]